MPLLGGLRVPPRTGAPARHLVVLLHGVGADGDDLIGLASALAAALPGAAFVAPNAPEPYDMAPFGYQWFSLRDRRPEALLLGVQAAAPVPHFWMPNSSAIGWSIINSRLSDSLKVRWSLHVAPRRPRAVAGVLGYSGALIGADRLPQEALSRPPVFLVHGEADEVVPAQAMYAAVSGLQAAGIPVQWALRRGVPHGISPDSIAHGAAFLAAAFAASGT